MKNRLRRDLRAALKARQAPEAQLLRALVAALDNAEARPIATARPAAEPHDFLSGTAEVARLRLDEHEVRRVLRAEIEEQQHAAAEMDRLKMPERAEALRAAAALARRYLRLASPAAPG